ncbi:MAG TPA: prephenate dehydratase domain-containing protein [Gammaproteobacteria bacterium]|jgi:prephenate dehydratase|nr:prephenate dehydratase domain-containing protein [Gammaproteobacteria bacterium]
MNKPQPIKLGVSGDPGSFSELAGLQYTKQENLQTRLVYLTDMQGVLAALSQGQIDLGIFPVVNFYGGLVTMAFEAMGQYAFTFLGEIRLEIQQCLLVKPAVSQQQIKQIVSHPQALAQCRDYLKTHFQDASLLAWQDTAKAAKALLDGELPATSAVIAPAHAAAMYGLAVLAERIQDVDPNITVFIIVEKRACQR